jgi:glycosyltransferase involved in cell wall biosynthesis
MTQASNAQTLWVQRVAGLDGHGVWVVAEGGPTVLELPQLADWLAAAERTMAQRAEVATVSIVTGDAAGVMSQAGAAALPLVLLSGRVSDVIGITPEAHRSFCSLARFTDWVTMATRRGLVHHWLTIDAAAWTAAGFNPPARAVPAGDHDVLIPAGHVDGGAGLPRRFTLGIDAAWLAGPESGAQVLVAELVRELARRQEIDAIVLISDAGLVPRALDGVAKVSGLSWPAALQRGVPLVDIMHRPYQPGADVDYARYYRVARCVAVTVLDFIAYDNPSYHESRLSWREYQQAFDEQVCQADRVFAISPFIASRLERQYAHQLSGPVWPAPLGTDHVSAGLTEQPVAGSPAVAALEGARFLLVLGNDFAHKNRDFAVKVFCDMRRRGYEGRLVLAGFHLDAGSSYGYELAGAEDQAQWIVRIGAVTAAEKMWLLRRAEAVLYPTSSEGFGLVPFEAAAVGTPTAFVSFGPLRDTLRGVRACSGWQVREFADHVFSLIAAPAAQVDQIRTAAASLTWKSCADQVLHGYLDMLRDGAPWQARRQTPPGVAVTLQRGARRYVHRAVMKLRRLAGRPPGNPA